MTQTLPPGLFARGSRRELRRLANVLRTETAGGLILVGAALVAMIWANSPWAASYEQVRELRVGPASLHLDLTLAHWAADGLLAVFFFLVGLELKHEFVVGDLRKPAKAIVPVAAAAGGVIVPALLYALVNRGGEGIGGWAIPSATDIAFALAVLALISSHLPDALRIFLLTLAVVDDLIAIIIIAVAYTDRVEWIDLAIAAVPIAVFAFVVHRFHAGLLRHRWLWWVVLLPLGIVAWALVHASGIHATIAGVLLGLCVPVRRPAGSPKGTPSLDGELEHHLRPLSAGAAVPLFALLSAGVAIGGFGEFARALGDPITLGVVLGLVVGKPLGIAGTTFLVVKLTRATLDSSVGWGDVIGVGVLGGVGFTVSLLVSELSFEVGPLQSHAKLGVLGASVLAALLAAVVLGLRNRRYRLAEEAAAESPADEESDDEDA